MNEKAITGPWRFAVYFLLVVLFIGIGYFTSREDFLQLFVLYSAAFALYILILKYALTEDLIQEGRYLGILLRFILLFSMPNLTDDFYRFIWDGKLVAAGLNPYATMPDQIVFSGAHAVQIPGLNTTLFEALNSKQYFTIYPPICQAIFAISAYLSFNSIPGNILLLKIVIFLFELGTIFLLPKVLELLKLPKHFQLLYILNPLIIIELTANIHFEALMVFFLVAAIYYLYKNNLLLSAIAFGFAIGAKLWPIMLLPLFFKYFGFKKTLQYGLISGFTAIIILFPMILQYQNIAGSVNLYFQQFEFNASTYYLLRFLINKDAHYDSFLLMRQLLPLFTIISICCLSYFYKKQYFFSALLNAFSIYCFFATTVHPWYLSPLIILSVFSSMRYAIVWSFLIYLSYITYLTPAYLENYYLIVLEYVIVIAWAIFEFRHIKRLQNGQG